MTELSIRPEEIRDALQRFVSDYKPTTASREEVGTVAEAGDGIARVTGLPSVMANELLEFEDGTLGIALNLEEESVGVVLLGDYKEIKEGDTVKRTNRIISVPVGDELIGRVVNALGQPIDGKGPIASRQFSEIERLAPGVVDRSPVKEPLQTGLKAIDAMVPIGRGQVYCYCDTPSEDATRPRGEEVIGRLAERLAGFAAPVPAILDALGPEETGIVVTHGAALRVGVAGLLGWPDEIDETLAGMDNCGWLRLRDGREPDTTLLMMALDALPPVAFDLGLFGWTPTLEFTGHIRRRPEPGWLQVVLGSQTLGGGMMEEDAAIWDSAGNLVAQSRQLCGVRVPR